MAAGLGDPASPVVSLVGVDVGFCVGSAFVSDGLGTGVRTIVDVGFGLAVGAGEAGESGEGDGLFDGDTVEADDSEGEGSASHAVRTEHPANRLISAAAAIRRFPNRFILLPL